MPRFYYPAPLATGAVLDLPPNITRHVQVLRLQPGDHLTLFNTGPGWSKSTAREDVHTLGGEYQASITHIGRSVVRVQVETHDRLEREPARNVHLAVGMPANDRMDWLIEKATELGVASIQPLRTQRSVLRLTGERADKKVAHWQSVAIAACEQCGGNRVPTVHPITELNAWMHRPASSMGFLLSLRNSTQSLAQALHSLQIRDAPSLENLVFLSGPEGGLSPTEEEAALACGFMPISLGPRILRAETAALAALVCALTS